MPIIETRNLCKRYGTVMRVTNLALQVPEGSIYGFLGPNGAGKSTTLKMILGLVRPTQGEIQVFGQPMNRGNRIAVLRQVGSLIESPSYYGHLTGEENLRIVQTLRGLPPKAIREVLEIVRLEGQRGKKVCHYSLGMKQRLGIATALLGYPKLLILDEPTNGLDPAGIQEMRELIRDLPSRFGMTVVVSSTCSVRSTRWPTPWASSGRGCWCSRTPWPPSMGAAATIWPCEPPTMRWPPRCSGRRASAGRRRGTIWSYPFSRTSRRPGCAGLWWRDAWGWSAWRSGRRAWRTSSWSSQGERK